MKAASLLTDRLCQLKDKQQSYEKTLAVVKNTWEELVDNNESRSKCTPDFVKHGRHFLLSRQLETGATESSSASTIVNSTEEDRNGKW